MPRIRRHSIPGVTATREAGPGLEPEYQQVLHALARRLGHAHPGNMLRALVWKEAERLGITKPVVSVLPPNVHRLRKKP